MSNENLNYYQIELFSKIFCDLEVTSGRKGLTGMM